MPSAFLPSCVSRAAISLAADASPNSSTRTPGWAAWAAATAASGPATRVLACSSVPASLNEVDDDRAAVLGGDRALDAADALDPPQPRHDVLHGGAPLRRVRSLHEHALVGLLGEVRGLDDHVAALGLTAPAG